LYTGNARRDAKASRFSCAMCEQSMSWSPRQKW
jgi:hypothetical protein